LTLLSIFIPFARILLAVELLSHFSTMIFIGFHAAFRQQAAYLIPGFLLATPMMHISWGVRSSWNIFTSSFSKHG